MVERWSYVVINDGGGGIGDGVGRVCLRVSREPVARVIGAEKVVVGVGGSVLVVGTFAMAGGEELCVDGGAVGKIAALAEDLETEIGGDKGEGGDCKRRTDPTHRVMKPRDE